MSRRCFSISSGEPSDVAFATNDAPPGLLRELILRLVQVQASESHRDEVAALIVPLILREIRALEMQPLHVPLPSEARLCAICEAIQADPSSTRASRRWGSAFGLSAKTLERDFRKSLGMSFGVLHRLGGLANRLIQLGH